MPPAPRRPLWAFTTAGHLLGPDPALDRRDVATWCEESGPWQPGSTWPGAAVAGTHNRRGMANLPPAVSGGLLIAAAPESPASVSPIPGGVA